MKLVGYGSKLSVEPGSTIDFMVSSEFAEFEAGLVRLIHGDENPAGPGFKAEAVASEIDGTHPGKPQRLRPGSYVRVPDDEKLDLAGSFTIQMWIRPTTPDKQAQTLLGRAAAKGGYALTIEDGRLTLRVGQELGVVARLERPLVAGAWYSVAAVCDAAASQVTLRQDPLGATATELADATTLSAALAADATGGHLTIGAALPGSGDAHADRFYNGKIDAPRLFARALSAVEVEVLRRGEPLTDGLLAAWDFSRDISSSAVTDVSGNELHGRTVNRPTRGMTGWNWDGTETAWIHAPDQYGAIHFHDDDLDDAGWERSFSLTVPEDLPSGIYAAHLRGPGAEDHVPFAVRPQRGKPTARILFLMPTFSYLAYANAHATDVGSKLISQDLGDCPSSPEDVYIAENHLKSLYNSHRDGSGVCYSSRLRPIVSMRPRYRARGIADGESAPHQFGADLHIIDWLDHHGYEFDVVTDEDLHLEGAELLEPYRAVLTGSHAEYWSLEMIRAAQAYLAGGGRMLSMGGNGMYWVTQHDPETGHSVEIRRRGPATRDWEPAPGEAHLSATGELGGLWRFRGIAPQSWIGVGSTSMGLGGAGRPYVRQPDSFSEDCAWVFAGIGEDEPIGDFDSLVTGGGAAGFEIERADRALGTPLRTRVLATATGFSDAYQLMIEDVLMTSPDLGGSSNPLVRADMTLLEYPAGGAVFATGSIAWSACLSHNGYDNNVSRLTRNVLDRFSSASETVLGAGSSDAAAG